MASIYKRNAVRKRKDKSWMIACTDENGRRRIVAGCTDRRATEEIAGNLEADVARCRRGVVTADDERYAEHANRPIDQHIEDYMGHCRHVGMNKKTLHMKQAHLKALIVDINATRLADLEPNAVERYLRGLKQAGRSARTVNHNRSDVVAFINWCVKTGRVRNNPLSIVPKLNE